MQKRALCVALCLAVLMSLTCYATAAESNVKLIINDTTVETEVAIESDNGTATEDAVKLIINGTTVETEVTIEIDNGTAYVSYWPILQSLYPDAVATWEDDKAVIYADGLEMSIRPSANYLEVNERYLWVEDGFKIVNNVILVPVRILGEALGATVAWDNDIRAISITAGSGPTTGSQVYQEDVVYWLSRIIYAESGNQSLEGQVAVGNVVLNRVASPAFPNTVYEVIFQSNQFSPVKNGTIYCTPTEECVMAAKLCLEGATTVQYSLYFINPRIATNSWVARNRPLVETIGDHAFFA